jgi:hypothetical protein
MEHRMILHENKTLFRQSIQFTADQLQIPAIYVEKDYWVTFALFTIFNDEIGKDTVFKGGTALSKCFNMIERFSEDIDLVVLRHEGETNNQLTNKIKKISSVVTTVMPETNIANVTQKMGMNRKTAHSYTKEFTGAYGQVRDVVIVEATWLGYFEPYTTKLLSSYVGEMMINNGQKAMAEANGLMPFEVRVLEVTRTLCEKIMSLVRFSYSAEPMDDLKSKIRHMYDLHQLLSQTEFAEFFNAPAFEEMLIRVAQDDVASFKNNNAWLQHHPVEALVFRNVEEVWKALDPVYSGQFRNLVYGKLPIESEIFATLVVIKNRLSAMNWKIELTPTVNEIHRG